MSGEIADRVIVEQVRLFLLGNALCHAGLAQRAPLLPQCVGFRADRASPLQKSQTKVEVLQPRLPRGVSSSLRT